MNSFKNFFKKTNNNDSASSINNILNSKYYYDSSSYLNGGSHYFQHKDDCSEESFNADIEYKRNGIFKRIIDEPVDNALRNWIEIKAENQDDIKLYNSIFGEMSLKTHISKAFKMTRLFGSAIFILNFNDDKELSEPVDFDDVADFDISFVARYGNFMPYFTDNLLQPDYYYLTKNVNTKDEGCLNIHPDRVILMLNDPLYDDVYRKYNQSTTNVVKKYIVKLEYLYNAVSKIIDMSMIDILKFNSENFLNSNNGSLIKEIQERISLISRGRSINKMIGITDKDDIKRIEANLNNFTDLIQKFQEELCSAADIPVQILFGGQMKGAIGGNAAGDNLMDIYYNKIESKQQIILRPVLDQFFSIASKVFKLDKIENFEFKALYQMSEMDKIKLEIEKLNLEKIRKSFI